jgi:Ca2+-binding EF-hand superfamily protein
MVSIETEARVAKILLTLAEGERNIEISRQVLNDNYDYDAYQIFKYFDFEGKNRIDPCNLLEFLRTKGIYANLTEINLIFLFYDKDYDGCLSYLEFLKLIQSEKSHKNSQISNSNNISYNIEFSLIKLLEKEIELSRKIISALNELKTRCDFNIHNIFHSLKGNYFIEEESLKNFLKRNKARSIISDIKAIIKRLDINEDGKIDLCEFHYFLGYPECQKCCTNISCFNCGCICCNYCLCEQICSVHHCYHNNNYSGSINNNNNVKINSYNNINDNFGLSQASTFFKSGNRNNEDFSENINDNNYYSPEIQKISPNLSLRISPKRQFSPKTSFRNSNINNYNNATNEIVENNNINNFSGSINSINNNNTMKKKFNPNEMEEKQFNEYLILAMNLESKIEELKCDLSSKNDFNCEDAFRIFELDSRNFLTEDDLKYGLYQLGIKASDEEIKLLIKRFDLQKEGILNYSDFFDMIVPFEKDYRNLVENRIPNSCCQCRCPDIFNLNTKSQIKKVFEFLIDSENKLNQMKKDFASLRVVLNQIFQLFDVNENGFFNESQLANYLKEIGGFTNMKDSDLLFIRLDKNRDGKVDYYELEDELKVNY